MKKSAKTSKKPSRAKGKKASSLSPKFKKLIEESVDRYLDVLGMKHYKTRVLYMKQDVEPSDERMMSGGTVAASTNVDMRYLRVTIRVYPNTINAWTSKRASDEEIKSIIAHEMAHIATHHLYTVGVATYRDSGEMTDAWEALTTIVGRLLYDVDKGRKKKNEKK